MRPRRLRPGFRAAPGQAPVHLVNIPLVRDRKRRFDDMQSFVSFRLKRRIAQWELTELLLSGDARDRRLVSEAIRATTPPARPKAKRP